jgi:hypothetical protein
MSEDPKKYPMPKRIIIDFDGTICGFAFPECGPPEPGVREALNELTAMGFEIWIHSCRTSSFWDGKRDQCNALIHYRKIIQYMLEHDLPYDRIIVEANMDKPIAMFYVDDRGIGYRGNWPAVVAEIKERGE